MMLLLTTPLEADVVAFIAIGKRSSSAMMAVAAERLEKALLQRRADRDRRAKELRAKGEMQGKLEPQLDLWILRPDGTLERWRGRMEPTACVACAHFNTKTMPLKVCLERQSATWPGGNKWKDGTVRAKKAGVHPYCRSGQCVQGKEYAASVVVGFSVPRFKFYRDDTPLQRKARKVYIRSRPDGEVPMMDLPAGAGSPIEFEDSREIDITGEDLQELTAKE